MSQSTSSEKRYTIELNESQLYALMNSCENCSRLMMGQFSTIKDICYRHTQGIPDYMEMRDIETQLKQMFYPELSPNAYHGIHSKEIPNVARTLFDFYQSARCTVSWDHSLIREWTLNFDDPYVTDHENTLPKVKVITNDPYYDIYISFFKRMQHSITQMIRKRGWKVGSVEYNDWIQSCKEFAIYEHQHITNTNTPLPSEEYLKFFNEKLDDQGKYILWIESELDVKDDH